MQRSKDGILYLQLPSQKSGIRPKNPQWNPLSLHWKAIEFVIYIFNYYLFC